MKKSLLKNLIALAFSLGALVFMAGDIFADSTWEDDIDGGGSENYVCSSGGPGSTACSVSVGGTLSGSGGSTSCSVECGPGYYACCNAWHNKCQCRAND